MTLHKINRDVDVSNQIFMDNAPEHTGYNTEMQRVSKMSTMVVHTTDPRFP